MFAGDFPFAQESSETVIWQVGNGIKQRLNELGCSTSLKSLIDVCWSFEPTMRPTFMSIFKELQHTVRILYLDFLDVYKENMLIKQNSSLFRLLANFMCIAKVATINYFCNKHHHVK